MTKKSIKDSLVIGFALFAMFFGAGNLIFPPFLGNSVGKDFVKSLIGFLLTGVGLPLLGIIASARLGGTFDKMAGRVGKTFATIATTILILSIGPMVAIPRTAATTYELGVKTIFPSASPIISSIVYFFIVAIFVLNPSKIIDYIGKVLTPMLLIVLATIIIKGSVYPIGSAVDTGFKDVFITSLKEGYQTMDAMASVIFASIIISSVKAKGYKDKKSSVKIIILSGLVSTIALTFVYGGLMYLGSQTSSIIPNDISRTELVLKISKLVLGNIGVLFLSISVALACLTTAIALVSASADFFKKLFKEKISYNVIAIVIMVISTVFATTNVDKIVSLAAPALNIIYPVVIILILITLLGNLVKSDTAVSITVYVTLIISILNTIDNLTSGSIYILNKVITVLPLSDSGLGWVIPSLIVLIISSIVFNKKK